MRCPVFLFFLTIAANGFGLGEDVETKAQKLSFAQKFNQRTELSATTRLSSGNETPPIANVPL